MTKPAHSEDGGCLCGIAANPKGYIDELGQKHEWILDGESVWHRVDGRTHSVQGVQGFLDYGVASLLQHQRQTTTKPRNEKE